MVPTGAEGGGQEERPELEIEEEDGSFFPLLLGAHSVTIYFLFGPFTSSKWGSRFTSVLEAG